MPHIPPPMPPIPPMPAVQEPLFLVDISHFQTGISIEQIASEGYVACICKASENLGRDATFDGFMPGCSSPA